MKSAESAQAQQLFPAFKVCLGPCLAFSRPMTRYSKLCSGGTACTPITPPKLATAAKIINFRKNSKNFLVSTSQGKIKRKFQMKIKKYSKTSNADPHSLGTAFLEN